MTKLGRRTAIRGALAAAGVASGVRGARAETWPDKPIRWIIPYAPGGFADVLTRMVFSKVDFGKPFVVDSRPGADGIIGTELVAQAAPDGYTFITVVAAHAINETLYAGKVKFDYVKSFSPVSLIAITPTMLLVTNDLPVKTVGELIRYAKANPGKLSYGSTGAGSAGRLTMELLKQATGIEMENVPYKGSAQAMADLAAGNIQVLVDGPSNAISHVRGGRIRALAMISKDRIPGVADIPTIVEAGGPAIESSSWLMFLAPAGTPPEIVERLSTEIQKAVKGPEISKQFVDMAVVPVGSTPAEATKFLSDEVAKWAGVIAKAGIKAEM
jgi:tripartite-type tricarboxylate transporter receptor subunit TctC